MSTLAMSSQPGRRWTRKCGSPMSATGRCRVRARRIRDRGVSRCAGLRLRRRTWLCARTEECEGEALGWMWPEGMVVLGHRGSPRCAPENTLESFLLALQQGSHGVELDVHLSRDGVPVVCHDPVVYTTDGTRLPVKSLAWSELSSIEVVSGDRPVKLCSLEELLDALPPTALLDVELKDLPTGDPNLAESPIGEVVASLLATKRSEGVLVTSFYLPHLHKARRAEPDLPRGLLLFPAMSPSSAFEMARSAGVSVLLPHDSGLPLGKEALQTAVEEVSRAGFATVVWTVDDAKRAIALQDAGVRGVISDLPDVVAAAISIGETPP